MTSYFFLLAKGNIFYKNSENHPFQDGFHCVYYIEMLFYRM